MNKSIFNLLCAVISGIIVILGTLVAKNFGINIKLHSALLTGVAVMALTLFGLTPAVRAKARHICCELDWADETVKAYQNIPALYRKSFWILFGFINLAFLFHTVNFMWGNRDWAAVRFAVDNGESLKEGRFAAYWLQQLFFEGKILPVINNLFAFLGLSFAAVLLGVYWNLEKKVSTFVIFGLFLTVTPYTLSWLYFAKNTLGNLCLPALVLTGLILSNRPSDNLNRAYAKNLIAILLFIICFGTYLPVINFIGVAVLGKILLDSVYDNLSLKAAISRQLQPLTNLTAGFLIFIFIFFLLKDTGVITPAYNTVLISFADVPAQLAGLFSSMFLQLTTPLPFIDLSYKIIALIVVITALFTLILKTDDTKTAIRGLALLPLVLIASRLAFFFSVPSSENPTFLARIDFYGLPLFYTLMLAVIIKSGGEYLKRIGYALALLLIFMSFVRVAYAQKVWKFGWDAETKLAERIITRLEKMPEFNINRQYKLLQIGEMGLRRKYYLTKSDEHPSGELLDWSYYPANLSKDAYNFYYQADFLSANATENEVYHNPDIRRFLLTKARPWPAKESLFIAGEYIVMVLNESALIKAQKALTVTSPTRQYQ